MSQCKAEERDYAPSVYYCMAEEGHTGPHEYRLASACCAEARREALEVFTSILFQECQPSNGDLFSRVDDRIRALAKEPKP